MDALIIFVVADIKKNLSPSFAGTVQAMQLYLKNFMDFVVVESS